MIHRRTEEKTIIVRNLCKGQQKRTILHHRLNDEESELLGLCQLYGFEHLPYEYVQKKGLIEVYRIRNHMQGHLNGLDNEMIFYGLINLVL